MSLFRFEIDELKGRPVPEELLPHCGAGLTVLMFYPGDFTAVCTKQLCSYNASKELVELPGVTFIAISPDGEASHKKFVEKYGFAFKLISDSAGEMFGAFQMNTFGIHGRGIVFVRDKKIVMAVRERIALTYMGADELKEIILDLSKG